MQKQLNEVFKKMPIEFVYVFGSSLTGHETNQSDVDIAILISKKISSKEKRFALRLNLIGQLSRIFKRDADVVVLNDTHSLFFKYIIIKEGQVLYQKSENQRIDMECNILSLYFDFQPFFDLYNKRYVQRSL